MKTKISVGDIVEIDGVKLRVEIPRPDTILTQCIDCWFHINGGCADVESKGYSCVISLPDGSSQDVIFRNIKGENTEQESAKRQTDNPA